MAKNIIVCSDGTGNTAIKGSRHERVQDLRGGDLDSHRYHAE